MLNLYKDANISSSFEIALTYLYVTIDIKGGEKRGKKKKVKRSDFFCSREGKERKGNGD